MNLHSWSGPHGVPGGAERWAHGSYRWWRGLELMAVLLVAPLLAPQLAGLLVTACGAALMLLAVLLMLRPRQLRRRFDVLALLVAIVALTETRK